MTRRWVLNSVELEENSFISLQPLILKILSINSKFSRKIWYTIILKATDKQEFILSLSLWKIHFWKTRVNFTIPVLHSFAKSQESPNSYKTKKLNYETIIRYRHCVKSQNRESWIVRNYAETVPFHKSSTPGN